MAAEEEQDLLMSNQDGVESAHDTTPDGLYHQLQNSLSKAIEDGSSSTDDGKRSLTLIDELANILSEKHEYSHLTRLEAMFRSALLLLQWRKRKEGAVLDQQDQDIEYNYEDIVKAHLSMTSNSNASSCNTTAFLSYFTLILNLHYRYTELDPIENELTLVNFTESTAVDIVEQWSGIQGGPLLYPDGRYDSGSILAGVSRTHAERWGEGVVARLDSLYGTQSIREQLREAYSRISGDASNVSAIEVDVEKDQDCLTFFGLPLITRHRANRYGPYIINSRLHTSLPLLRPMTLNFSRTCTLLVFELLMQKPTQLYSRTAPLSQNTCRQRIMRVP
jgi:hypothetical protein